VTRAGRGNSTKRRRNHVPEQSQPHRILGGDAEVRNANNRSFTTLSLATKSCYKDKQNGQFVARTEWHRCVIFGELAEFAATLTKGAHVQVEGELRSREIAVPNSDFKRRIWEISVDSILKLDRAEKAGPEDQDDRGSAWSHLNKGSVLSCYLKNQCSFNARFSSSKASSFSRSSHGCFAPDDCSSGPETREHRAFSSGKRFS
jgi:single-strand DNA-binding protein